MKFLTKEPIVGLKISDGDTLKKRVQITFESAGHFNLFALKIRLWLGLSVVSRIPDFLMSQDTNTELQSQRIRIEEPEPEFKIPLSQYSNYGRESQQLKPELGTEKLDANSRPTVALDGPSQAELQQATQQSTQQATQQATQQSFQSTQQTVQSTNPTIQLDTTNSPYPYQLATPQMFRDPVHALLSAAETLQNRMGGVMPTSLSQQPISLPYSDQTLTLPFKNPVENSYLRYHQPVYAFDRPDLYRHPPISMSQPMQKRPKLDESFASQSTQKFDNSCFSFNGSINEAQESSEGNSHSPVAKLLITDLDLKKAMEDVPFVPSEELGKRKRKGKAKLDGLFTKVLDEAMKNEYALEELDDNALRFEIALKLKSKSFIALAKRIDTLIRDNEEKDS